MRGPSAHGRSLSQPKLSVARGRHATFGLKVQQRMRTHCTWPLRECSRSAVSQPASHGCSNAAVSQPLSAQRHRRRASRLTGREQADRHTYGWMDGWTDAWADEWKGAGRHGGGFRGRVHLAWWRVHVQRSPNRFRTDVHSQRSRDTNTHAMGRLGDHASHTCPSHSRACAHAAMLSPPFVRGACTHGGMPQIDSMNSLARASRTLCTALLCPHLCVRSFGQRALFDLSVPCICVGGNARSARMDARVVRAH